MAGMGMSKTSYSNIIGANNRVRVGVVGIKGQGFMHIQKYSELLDVEVAALCDVDETLFAQKLKWLDDKGKAKPLIFGDIRDLLDTKDIDAIDVCTPNHWHALAGIWAVQAGKHVTIEKPATHNVFEGRQLINAAKKYNKLIQQHSERRCHSGFKNAINFLHSGGLGEVYMAKGICYKWRDTIGKKMDGPVPQGVNYDLWLGPAQVRPFNANRFHYNWHWNWEYGNGDLGNQGIHQMDIARWGLGVKHPTNVYSMGGHFMFDDDQQTPNVQMSMFEFNNPEGGGDKKKILQFEVRHWISNSDITIAKSDPNIIGNLFFGSKGYMEIDLGGNWKTYLGQDKVPGPSGSGNGDMFQNFVDSIRANDRSMLEGDIEIGHYSCALVHLANISYRLGRNLKFDSQKEIFINDNEANSMLTRDYRAPFVVPVIS
jgi:predicted dehydrogenase